MPTYVSLVKFTDKGIEEIRQAIARLDVAKVAFTAMGADLVSVYMTMGPWDAVVIVEAPDDETAMKIELINEFKGHVRSETFRAFTEEEYRKIVAAMPEERTGGGQRISD